MSEPAAPLGPRRERDRPTRATVAAIAAVLAVAATAGPARADDPLATAAAPDAAPRLEVDQCPVAPDLTADRLSAIASEHYERGGVLYYQGDYDGAIREFVSFLCLLPSGTSALFSIAQSYERLLDFEKAIAYYERYLDALGDTGPAAERRNIRSRIQVLAGLPARIQVTTTPGGAAVTFTDDEGVRRNFDQTSDTGFLVRVGRYTMRVELPGYVTVEQPVEPRIGQPYSYFFALEPKQGHLVVNAEPADARIFVDDRLVGIGRYESDVPGGSYLVTVEAANRLTERRQIEIAAERTTTVPVSLPRPPASGRTQLLLASSVGGGLLGGVALGVLQDSTAQGGLGAVGGIALGLVGAYYGVPRDIEVGESSYIITSAIVGGVEAGLAAGIAVDTQADPNGSTVTAVAIGGMAVGAIFGATTATKFHLDAGDAALLNSGALWGGIGGGLFSAIFEFQPRISEGLVLGGLNLGIIAGALLGRQVEISRGHAALIDLAGFAGMGVAVATQSAIDNARHTSDTTGERSAHFALGGMAVGLAAGAYLTRKLDAPKVPRLAPVLSSGTDAGGRATTMIGLGGRF